MIELYLSITDKARSKLWGVGGYLADQGGLCLTFERERGLGGRTPVGAELVSTGPLA